MFKKLSISLTALVFVLALTCTSFCAFAMGPSEDGVYEVPIEMWHAEKERTSMGDSYIVHTALLTVDGDEKTLTKQQAICIFGITRTVLLRATQ